MYSKNRFLGIDKFDIENAQNFLYNLDKNYFKNYVTYSQPIKRQIFYSNDDISSFIKPTFDSCKFYSPKFNGIVGENAVFDKSDFHKCNIQTANFRFSKFNNCRFYDTCITNSSLEDIAFYDDEFNNCEFCGCSLANSYIKDCLISKLDTKYCNFEGAIFSDITMINTNFLNTGFRYAEFVNVVIENVVFPFLDFFHTFNGLVLLLKYSEKISLGFPNSNRKLSGKECLENIELFLAYFYEKLDYFAIANICIYLGKHEDAYYNIINGLRDGLEKKDFKLIVNLSKLASYNCFFSRKQLHDFYNLLQSNKITKYLSSHEYKYYLTEMMKIKNLLIDKPFGMPQICIEINTTIQPNDYDSLNLLLQKIDWIADSYVPEACKYLTLRHNSPDVLELFLSDALPNLLIFVGYLGSIFWGGTKIIKELQEILKNHEEIKGISLDNLIKEQELEKLKLENDKQDEEIYITYIR